MSLKSSRKHPADELCARGAEILAGSAASSHGQLQLLQHGVLQLPKGPQVRGVKACILRSSSPFLASFSSLLFSFSKADNQFLHLRKKEASPAWILKLLQFKILLK